MLLNGIDIDARQNDLNITNVIDTDFVIVKATDGVARNNQSFQRHMLQGFGAKKLMGCYHSMGSELCRNSPIKEAKRFMMSFGPFVGKAAPFLDLTSMASEQSVSWAIEWLEYVKNKTGVCPGVRINEPFCQVFDSRFTEYPLWLASQTECNQIKCDPWEAPKILQRPELGTIQGYGANLDIDLFYGSKSDWEMMQAISR